MNKNSSLVKRAIVFTAAIVSTMVVVTLLVYLLAFGRGGNALPLLWSVLVGLGAAAVVALRLCAAYFRWNLPKASPSPGGARR